MEIKNKKQRSKYKKKDKHLSKNFVELAAERLAEILIAQVESSKNKNKYNYVKQK